LKEAGLSWHGWHGFRRGQASNLNRLGVDDSVIQQIMRHADISTTQHNYIKVTSPESQSAMKRLAFAFAKRRS
jgi:site-specific recombinase XerD